MKKHLIEKLQKISLQRLRLWSEIILQRKKQHCFDMAQSGAPIYEELEVPTLINRMFLVMTETELEDLKERALKESQV